MNLYVKYMVSLRCKIKVREELAKLGLIYAIVELGTIEIFQEVSDDQIEELRINLSKSGLELLDNKKSILVEQIKNVIVEMIHFNDEVPKVNFSVFLSEKLELDYTYLSNLFSEVKGITIEHYIILNKIERVKEFILYDELSYSEIAIKLHYSSLAHLSAQFKKETGLTLSYFGTLAEFKRRKVLEVL
jgi:AraC-like DNA-binding protein